MKQKLFLYAWVICFSVLFSSTGYATQNIITFELEDHKLSYTRDGSSVTLTDKDTTPIDELKFTQKYITYCGAPIIDHTLSMESVFKLLKSVPFINNVVLY
ncbi:MAG: hypothetical protein HON43_01775 [Alphaproteobacteria bacterium]|jgi:hypothetical protein|nr:hypothetical protein [Alphaproteobacteria bacterium]MBT5390639.1 hypothetical protein [Alphaproteobacteria bacterium]